METGSTSSARSQNKKSEVEKKGGSSSSSSNGTKSKIEPFVSKTDHSPNELRSWAKRTGFVSNFSGESGIYSSSYQKEKENDGARFDLEQGGLDRRGGIDMDPVQGRRRDGGTEIEPVLRPENGEVRSDKRNGGVEPLLESKEGDERKVSFNESGNGNEVSSIPASMESKKDDVGVGRGLEYGEEEEVTGLGGWHRGSEMMLRLTENPGFVPLIYYAVQHYLSLAGSLIFVPLIMVPAMGGTDKDIATVISTLLLVSGITTILQSYFGTRLPLVQGSSFVYLAPALVIINAKEYRNLTEHKFRHIMRELQGAIIVGSIFQSILGFSGLMSLLLRLINPVVVAPTVAAVGLAFFSYGFPQAGSCVEISIPQILLLLIFTLYLRGISIFGHRLFLVYAVPLSAMIIWSYAFFLTAGGAYDYKGCSLHIPSSNILVDACIKHAYTMKHCRTDVSNAWRNADWIRIPYPFQWGMPVFHLRTSIIMIIVSLVASVDSVGTYHSVSLRVNMKRPSLGIVSRGIGLEGFCSILAGLWGTGTGSTTLTENVHTIDTTKVASRKVVELGAVFLVFFSFIGKVGAILASIPLALAASIVCFIWALIVALGLSTLQCSQAASVRNIKIIGVSLFLGLSVPAYFQQYQPDSSLILPAYFVPYSAASNGPVRTNNEQIDFAINALMSLNMVVTFMVALILDNTVPGSRKERGVYKWSGAEDIENDPSSLADYSLPRRFYRFFSWGNRLG